MGDYIFMTVFLVGMYFVFKRLFLKKEPHYKNVIIYSVSTLVFTSIISIGSIVNKSNSVLLSIYNIVLILVVSVLTIIYYYRKKDKDVVNKPKEISLTGLSIMGQRIAYLCFLIIDILIVLLVYLISEGDKFDSNMIIHLVILGLILLWNIGFNIYLIINKVKKISLIVINNYGYVEHEVSGLRYDLAKMMDLTDIIITREVKGFIKFDKSSKYIRVFYVDGYILPNESIYSSAIFKHLATWTKSTITLRIKVEEVKK